MLTAAIGTSMILTIIIAETALSGLPEILLLFWFGGSILSGFFIPAYLVPEEWIDYSGKIPPHTFWKELLS